MNPTDDAPVNLHAEVERLKSENEALRSYLQQLNTITMANADVVYKMNADWSHLLELNAPDFLASTREPDQQWMERYILPEDQPVVLEAIRQAIEGKRLFELEHPVVKADGTAGWTLSKAIPVLDQQGNIKEWLGLALDITARKKAEEDMLHLIAAAEQQQRLYETITDSTPDLVYVFDVDARFSYANKALLTMWGRTQEDSFGKSLLEVGYEPWHAAMHEREIDHIKKNEGNGTGPGVLSTCHAR